MSREYSLEGKPKIYKTIEGEDNFFLFLFFFPHEYSFQRWTKCVIFVLRLYSEGWLLDVFRRIHGEEGTFFVPLDLEISIQELSYIMKRAEQWRGINGERRMVSGEQSHQNESVTYWCKFILCISGYYLKGPRYTRRLFLQCFFEWRSWEACSKEFCEAVRASFEHLERGYNLLIIAKVLAVSLMSKLI